VTQGNDLAKDAKVADTSRSTSRVPDPSTTKLSTKPPTPADLDALRPRIVDQIVL
jgi:hypothetical protein